MTSRKTRAEKTDTKKRYIDAINRAVSDRIIYAALCEITRSTIPGRHGAFDWIFCSDISSNLYKHFLARVSLDSWAISDSRTEKKEKNLRAYILQFFARSLYTINLKTSERLIRK